MAALDTNSEEWWKKGPVAFLDDEDPDDDPMFRMEFEPPPGYQRLPVHEEVSGGE